MRGTAQMGKGIKRIVCGVVTAALLVAVSLPVFALDDGAYIVSRTTSYVNPETGETVDGGTNIALGDSMCASIVEEEALVEQSQGKTYVTLGLGLMSNVSDVRIQIQGDDGSYRNAEIVKTGSCERVGDTCNHYRFEVDSADNYISPILYVTPMGRDVQFFVKLDTSSAAAGTGNFISEMVTTAETPVEDVPVASEEPAASSEAVSSESVSSQAVSSQESLSSAASSQAEESSAPSSSSASSESAEEESGGNTALIVWIVVAVVVVAGAVAFVIYKKRRKP